MMNYIIESYLKKLSYDDYLLFLNKYNIILDDKTCQYFYDLLKNNYHDILIRPDYYLDIIKKNVDENNYHKIYNLYSIYSKKLYH